MIRTLVALSLMVATAAYVQLHPPANLAAGHGVLRACPERFGDWNGTELSFEDAVVEELRADDLLIRRYQRGNDVAWLCVVYHQNHRYGAHDPHLCYESQGYVVEQTAHRRLTDGSPGGLEANQFVAVRPHDRRLVYYWWSTAGLSTSDIGAFRSRMALSGALQNRSWGAFVRVETLIREGDEAGAMRSLDDFAGRVAVGLTPLLAGSAGPGVAP